MIHECKWIAEITTQRCLLNLSILNVILSIWEWCDNLPHFQASHILVQNIYALVSNISPRIYFFRCMLPVFPAPWQTAAEQEKPVSPLIVVYALYW